MDLLVPPLWTVALRLAPVLLLSHQVRRPYFMVPHADPDAPAPG
jgi:hypothetical protein